MDSIKQALNDLRHGKMIIVVDDEDRENEGDLVIAAEHATPAAINFMINHARGLVCLALTDEDFTRLQIPMMTQHNHATHQTPFGVSIEAATGVTTGISAHDRSHTIQTAIDSHSSANDIVMPGHIFPLRANPAGVLARNGHTEAGVDLARLAGLKPAAVICEILNADGTMARVPDLETYAKQHHLSMITIRDLQTYRIEHETLVEETAAAKLPMEGLGQFHVKVFKSKLDNAEHVAFIREPFDPANVLMRIHSECLTGDIFHSKRCDCGKQLQQALAAIDQQGGVLLYLRQEGRGIGLANKIKAYALQEQGLDTVEANVELGFKPDEREYGIAAQMLRQLGVHAVSILTNNPHKVSELQRYGIDVKQRVPINVTPNGSNIHYLETKLKKMQHWLNLSEEQINV